MARTPTQGERHVLQLLCRVAYVLTASRPALAPVAYTIRERGSGRALHPVAPAMAERLLAAGWIERAPGGSREAWAYRVTPAGIAAAHMPA